MPTYLMFGKYSREAIEGISAERTKKASALIEEHGGKYKGGYVLLGEKDLVLITEFPGTEEAMKASIALTKLTGIAFSTSPAVTVEEFDRMMG